MLKTLAILAVFLTVHQATVPATGKATNNPAPDNSNPQQSRRHKDQPAKPTIPIRPQEPDSQPLKSGGNEQSADNQHAAINITESAPGPVAWRVREWITWGANILLVASERAWMIAVPDSPDVPAMSVGTENMAVVWHFINKGKTPAYLLEIGTGAVVLPSTQYLPQAPPACDIRSWGKRGVPLLPEAETTSTHERIVIPQSSQLRTRQKTLWVFGYIHYRDVSRKHRETHFCYRWEPVTDTGTRDQFTPDGTDEYNRAT
jgi:hypothetical protein